MKNIIIKSLALISILAPFTSIAGESEAINDDGQFYGQIESGITKMNIHRGDLDATSTSQQQASFTLRAGYELPLLTTVHLGLEAGYLYLGKYRYNGVYYYGIPSFNFEMKQQGFDVLTVVKKDINPHFSIFAKIGLAYSDLSINASALNTTASYRDSYTSLLPEIAGGVSFKLNDSLSITGTVSHLFQSEEDISVSSSSAAIGLRVNFN